jgi:hypothetical protein
MAAVKVVLRGLRATSLMARLFVCVLFVLFVLFVLLCVEDGMRLRCWYDTRTVVRVHTTRTVLHVGDVQWQTYCLL